MLQIAQSAFDRLRQHGESTYPDESCGVLLGTASGGVRIAAQALAVENNALTKRNRYRIAPIELVRIEKTARRAGLEILGFYHSHPDHLAQPSSTDLAEAHWLGCSYVITTVANGSAAQTRSFYLEGLREEEKRFGAETLRIVPSPRREGFFD